MTTGDFSSLRVTSSIVNSLPTVITARTGVAWGHMAWTAALGAISNTRRVAPPGSAFVSITFHGTVRAGPWPGFAASVAWGPNQGQQMGTPPRIDLPAASFAALLIQITGCWPFGAQVMTCAPCSAMDAVARLLVTSATTKFSPRV